ncbi:short chain dehydrogenase [Naviculisporaceae sp. PSN 640]
MSTLIPQTMLSWIGLLSVTASLAFLIDLIAPFLRPSQITRFLHTAPGSSPSSAPLHPWALITGATSGIGLALAQELASQGFNIVLHGRNASKLEEINKSLSDKFPSRQFRTLVIDATSAPTSPDIFKDVIARLSDIHLTVLINNAGGTVLDPTSPPLSAPYLQLSELSHTAILSTISLNLTFPLMLTSALLPVLSHRNNGPALVITVGSFADIGLPLVQVYGGTKAGLGATMEALSRELTLRPAGQKKRETMVHHMRIGHVTGVSHEHSPASLFRPDATTAAKAIVARVGCGRTVIEPHWSMRLQAAMVGRMPWWVKDMSFGGVMASLRDEAITKRRA